MGCHIDRKMSVICGLSFPRALSVNRNAQKKVQKNFGKILT